jgi:hypothetical protein
MTAEELCRSRCDAFVMGESERVTAADVALRRWVAEADGGNPPYARGEPVRARPAVTATHCERGRGLSALAGTPNADLFVDSSPGAYAWR